MTSLGTVNRRVFKGEENFENGERMTGKYHEP